MINSLLERGDTIKACVKSGPDGLSGAKVLNAIADDKSWILFRTIAIVRFKWTTIRKRESDPFIKVKFNTQTVLPTYQSFNVFRPYQ